MNTGGNYFEAGVAVPHTRWCQIANSRERERVEFGLRRQAERDAALPRANQPAATGDEASPAPCCDGASQPRPKALGRMLLWGVGAYGLASGKAASPLRSAAAVQIRGGLTGEYCAGVGRAVLCPPPPANGGVRIDHDGAHGVTRPTCAAFTLLEVMVSMALLSLIVLVLMSVFSSTQSAFRAAVTQTDVMASGRATMDMLAADARLLSPSHGTNYGAVNFLTFNHDFCFQSLPASTSIRTNVTQWLFFLGRQNTKWVGMGYLVDETNAHSIYPLYRFYAETNLDAGPATLYKLFLNNLTLPVNNTTVWSHLMDGVVHLVVRAYDTNGYWLTNGYTYGRSPSAKNTFYSYPYPPYTPNPTAPAGEIGCTMYSNTLPAALEIQMGVLEDSAIRRLESLLPPNTRAYDNYFTNQANHVQVFRQRITIPNCDPTAYQ